MKRFIVVLCVVALAAMALAAPSFASTNNQRGFYMVTSSGVAGAKALSASNSIMYSGGTGGTASSRGSRSAYIKTTIYSLLGAPIVDIKTTSNWSWSSGVVTSHSWNEPVVTKRWGGCNITSKVTYGQSGWRVWNGRAHGCWYQSVKIHVVESILKIGIVGEWDIIHEYWLHGNGTYKWHSNY